MSSPIQCCKFMWGEGELSKYKVMVPCKSFTSCFHFWLSQLCLRFVYVLKMGTLPESKDDLRFYLKLVDDEVMRCKGKLPFFVDDEVRSLLLRGDGDKLRWTKAANAQFRHTEFCTHLEYQTVIVKQRKECELQHVLHYSEQDSLTRLTPTQQRHVDAILASVFGDI